MTENSSGAAPADALGRLRRNTLPINARRTLRPEFELLLACGRSELDGPGKLRIKRLLGEGLDWGRLIPMASAHGMLPLLYFHMSNFNSGALPKAILEELRVRSRAATGRSLLLAAELAGLLQACDAAGISATPFKGPTLAAMIYGNLALRGFTDIDIAVRPGDVSRAIALMMSRGYRARFPVNGEQVETHRSLPYAREFVSTNGKILVDLHWGFAKKYFSCGLDLESVWDRRESVYVSGTSFSTFSPEAMLLILCLHGAKHGPIPWPRLMWICDVAELIRVHPRLDWAWIIERARATGCQRILLLGLSLASDLFDAELPAEIDARVHSDQEVEKLAAPIRYRLSRDTRTPPSPLARARFDLRAQERLRDKVRYCLRRLFTPGTRDRNVLQLPRALSALYIPVRILRLSARYVSAPWKLRRFWSTRTRVEG